MAELERQKFHTSSVEHVAFCDGIGVSTSIQTPLHSCAKPIHVSGQIELNC